LDERLDEAFDESFPASDPAAVHPPDDVHRCTHSRRSNRSEYVLEIIAMEVM
jgi:hypothetical protein